MIKPTKKHYQKLYDETDYGKHTKGRNPSVRYLKRYEKWIGEKGSKVIDYGCGTGELVEILNRKGFQAKGIDQIKYNPNMIIGDITRPLKDFEGIDVALSFDVLEHLELNKVHKLLNNLSKAKKAIFTIHNGPSVEDKLELHITRMTFEKWEVILREYFDLHRGILLHENQKLYLATPKSN